MPLLEHMWFCRFSFLTYRWKWGSLVNRWRCINGCIRTWQQWYLCMKISLTFPHLGANSLRSAVAVRLKILVGGRSSVSGDQDPYYHCVLLRSTTSLYLLKGPRNWGPWLGGMFYFLQCPPTPAKKGKKITVVHYLWCWIYRFPSCNIHLAQLYESIWLSLQMLWSFNKLYTKLTWEIKFDFRGKVS